MENDYILKISEIAYEDLDGYTKYISENLSNPQAAQKIVTDIENALENIKIFPFSCSLIENNLVKKDGVRKLVVNKFIVFYKVEDNFVKVIRIMHSTRNYQDII